VGIRYGHELSKRLQSEHWVRDNEKQEYREVLGVLTSSFATIVRCGSAAVVIGAEEMRARNQAEQAALETLRDRLFIADKLKEINAFDRWLEATRDFDNDKEEKKFALRFGNIIFDIRSAALHGVKKS
jgi:hypothetical protein